MTAQVTTEIVKVSSGRRRSAVTKSELRSLMECLHVQQTSSKCIQNTRANAGRLLDRVNTL